MKLRIESDGTVHGTLVLTEGGEMVKGVQSVKWEGDIKSTQVTATIVLTRVPLNAMVDLTNVTLRDADLIEQQEQA